MPSDLEEAALQWRKQLLNNEKAQIEQLRLVYNAAWYNINTEISRLYAKHDAAIASGNMSEAQRLKWRIDNTKVTGNAIDAELQKLAQLSAAGTGEAQRIAVEQAMAHMSALPAQLGVNVALTLPNFKAVEALVGFAGDGSPLIDVYNKHAKGAGKEMAHLLARNLAQGVGIKTTAAQMRKAFGTARYGAALVARTETLRAYRQAQSLTMQKNADVLDGWIWVSACDRRSCAACFAMHGTFHKVTETLSEHPGGRCVQAPAIKGRKNIVPSGESRFAALPVDIQRKILGKAAHEAWLDGAVTLDRGKPSSIVGMQRSKAWGDSIHVRSLKSIVGAQSAKDYGDIAKTSAKYAQSNGLSPAQQMLFNLKQQDIAAANQKRADAAQRASERALQQAARQAQAAQQALVKAQQPAPPKSKKTTLDEWAQKIATAQQNLNLAQANYEAAQLIGTPDEIAAAKKKLKSAKTALYDKQWYANVAAQKAGVPLPTAAQPAQAAQAPIAAKTATPPAPKMKAAAAQPKAKTKTQAQLDAEAAAKAQKAADAAAKKQAAQTAKLQKQAQAALKKANDAWLKNWNAQQAKDAKALAAQAKADAAHQKKLQAQNAALAKQQAAQQKLAAKAAAAAQKQQAQLAAQQAKGNKAQLDALVAQHIKNYPWYSKKSATQSVLQKYPHLAPPVKVLTPAQQLKQAQKQQQQAYNKEYKQAKKYYPWLSDADLHAKVVNWNPHLAHLSPYAGGITPAPSIAQAKASTAAQQAAYAAAQPLGTSGKTDSTNNWAASHPQHAPPPPKFKNDDPDRYTSPPKVFSTATEASKWATSQKNFGKWHGRNDLTQQERDGINFYTGNHYSGANKKLRGIDPTPLNEKQQQMVQGVDNAMGKFRVPETIIVYRGFDDPKLTARIKAKGAANMAQEPYDDDGIMSTSINPSWSWGGSMEAIITMPKGSYGSYVYENSQHPGEYEVILPRGSHFTITEVRETSYKTTVVMTLIQD
jgi:SPP1 gp7 family putative phage head morphogenesis protein